MTFDEKIAWYTHEVLSALDAGDFERCRYWSGLRDAAWLGQSKPFGWIA